MSQETMDVYSTALTIKSAVLLINKKALIWFSLLFSQSIIFSPWRWINALEFSLSTTQCSWIRFHFSSVPVFVKLKLHDHWNNVLFLFSIVLCSEFSTIEYQGCRYLNLAWGRKRESERDREMPKVQAPWHFISIGTMPSVLDLTRWAETMRERWSSNNQHLCIESLWIT